MKTQNIQKLITFSPHLYSIIQSQAKKVGLSFNEYIKHVAVKDFENSQEPVEYLDEETEKRLEIAMKDLNEGKYVDVDVNDNKALRKALGIIK